MVRFLAAVGLALVLAAPQAATAREGGTGKWVDLAVGVKGTGGANLWTSPSDPNLVTSAADMAFAKSRMGGGGGGGLWAEARFIKFLGLETGLLVEWDTIWENLNLGNIHAKFTATAYNLRIPLLVKAVLPLPGIRLGAALGPEFVVPVSASGSVDVPIPGLHFDVSSKASVMLTMGLDFTITLPYHLLLPIGIRASYNLTQSSVYADRVPEVTSALTAGKLVYQNTWDFRLQLGLGYEF